MLKFKILKAFTFAIAILTIIIPLFAFDDYPSVTYLNIGEHHKFVLTPINPILVCIRDQHWITLTSMAFQTYLFEINSTAHRPFSVRIYHSINEEQLRNLAPWRNHHPRSLNELSLFTSFSTPPEPQMYHEVTENSRIPLSGLHSHCVALLPSVGQLNEYNSVYEIAFTCSWDFNRIFRLISGMFVYFSADLLCKNIIFYYFSGVSLTVLGSFLILIILGLRLFPQRTSLFIQGLILISGGAVSLLFFCLDKLRNAIGSFITNNLGLFLCYVFFVSIISIIIFYWLQLPEVLLERFPRTVTLMKFFMRLLGIGFIASAPQMPNEIQTLQLIADTSSNWINDYLTIDLSSMRSFVDISSNTLARLLFGVCVAFGLHLCSDFFSADDFSRKQLICQRHKKSANLLPPIPCAASSPAPGAPFDRKPIFSPPPYYTDSPFSDKPHRRLTSGSMGRWDDRTFSPVLPNRHSLFQSRQSTSFVNGCPFSSYPKSSDITPNYKYAPAADLLTDDED